MKVEQPGASAFIELSDVPNTYVGAGSKAVTVEASATGLEFTTPGAGSVSWGGITGTLSNQTDLQTALNAKVTSGGALGTPSSGTLTNVTGLPIAGLVSSTSTALGVGSLEIGAASDTTLARVSAGIASIEGDTIATANNTLTLTLKTLTTPVIGGTPASTGQLGYNTTNGQITAYSGLTSSVGSFPRVLSVTRPAQGKTNSTAADQDYTSIYTIPANVLTTNKILRVTLTFKLATGTSSVTTKHYLKLGSTKLIDSSTFNPTDGITRGLAIQFLIIGTAAAGASVSVEGTFIAATLGGGGTTNYNLIAQPVAAIATNGTLDIVPGVTFSGTGSTETLTVLTAIVEELN